MLFEIAVERLGETRNMGFSATEIVAQADEQVDYLTRYDHVVNIMTGLANKGVLEVVSTAVDGGER